MKKVISILLVCVFVFTVCGNSVLAATDQPSAWAADGVARAKELNLVTDELDKAFQSPTTRAEFCGLIIRMLIVWYDTPIDYQIEALGLTLGEFNDIADVSWPYSIRAAAALGITSGTGNGNFSPDQQLTREQAATMLRNALNVFGIDTANPQSVQWADSGEISTWAREATDVMYAATIMNGTNANPLTFSPKSHYTHEQAIITMLNLWDYATSQDVTRTFPESDIEYGKGDRQSETVAEAIERLDNLTQGNVTPDDVSALIEDISRQMERTEDDRELAQLYILKFKVFFNAGQFNDAAIIGVEAVDSGILEGRERFTIYSGLVSAYEKLGDLEQRRYFAQLALGEFENGTVEDTGDMQYYVGVAYGYF
jgi:S-layer homology domain.